MITSNGQLPLDYQSIVGDEEVDFAIKASRKYTNKQAIGSIIFGLVWLFFIGIFLFIFILPIFSGQEVNFTANGVPQTASRDNLSPLFMPIALISVFFLVGLVVFVTGIFSLFISGDWFLGTNKRFITIGKNKVHSMDWEEFSGNVEIRGNNTKGNIILELRTGRRLSRNSGSSGAIRFGKNTPFSVGNNSRYSGFVPEIVKMVGIEHVYDIEKILRQRIKENDPTPSTKS